MQYAVKETYTFYNMAVEEITLPIIASTPRSLTTNTGPSPILAGPEWRVSPGKVLMTVADLTVNRRFQDPFTGGAKIVQAAAACSVALDDVFGHLSLPLSLTVAHHLV
jgi:hypothetical protein